MPQHKMPQQILGFGPLLRVGFKLIANNPGDITLVFPNGRKVPVQLGPNDILYIEHEYSAACRDACVAHDGKQQRLLQLLHDTFNHASKQRIIDTLKNTLGHKVSIDRSTELEFCEPCAEGRMKRNPLSKSRNKPLPNKKGVTFVDGVKGVSQKRRERQEVGIAIDNAIALCEDSL